RELEHVISRAALRTVSLGANRNEIITIGPELLALESTSNDHDNFLSSTCFHVSDSQSIRQVESTYPSRTQAEQKHTQSLREATEFFQRKQIRERLEQHNGNWAATARSLELDTSNLHKLAKKLGLK
ncbi:MAG TPA: nitric oxide reductase transcription regulator, partial [Alcaligenaceae bacterium]|nr:nitric oxide reductase transcription regulator [Alcaligenaceae bacterium]